MTLIAPQDVVTRGTERKARQGARLNAYARFLAAYQLQTRSPGSGADILGNYADGRPALREHAQTMMQVGERPGAPNFIYPIVKDLAAIRGVLPTIDVPDEQPGDTDTSTLRTRALMEQFTHSNMASQQAQAAFFLSCLGDAVYTIDPLIPKEAQDLDDPMQPPGVYINVVSPMIAFPRFMTGRDARECADCYIIDVIDQDGAEERWNLKLGTRGGVVYTHYTRHDKQIVVEDTESKLCRRVSAVEHGLGFCPVQWASNEITDGQLAQSDISRAVDLHYELQSLFHIVTDSVVAATYPITVVKGGQQATKGPIAIGPGSIVTVDPINGGLELLAPAAAPQNAQLIFDIAYDNLMQVTGMSPIRMQGEIDRSNVSARSVRAQQSPMQSRVALSQTVLGDVFQRICAKTMLMLHRIPELKKADMPLYGTDKKGSFNTTFTGSDMGGFTRTRVHFESFAGSDRTERLHNALLLFKSNPQMYPWRRVLEEAGELDPAAVMAEATAQAQAMQAQSQPPGPAEGPSGPPAPGTPGAPGASPAPSPLDAGGGAPGPPPDQGPAQPPTAPAAGMPPVRALSYDPTQAGQAQKPSVPDVMGILQQAVAPFADAVVDGPRLEPPSGKDGRSGQVFVAVDKAKVQSAVREALMIAVAQIDPNLRIHVVVKKREAAA